MIGSITIGQDAVRVGISKALTTEHQRGSKEFKEVLVSTLSKSLQKQMTGSQASQIEFAKPARRLLAGEGIKIDQVMAKLVAEPETGIIQQKKPPTTSSINVLA